MNSGLDVEFEKQIKLVCQEEEEDGSGFLVSEKIFKSTMQSSRF